MHGIIKYFGKGNKMEKTIKELEAEIAYYRDKITACYDKIEELTCETELPSFEGRFIYHKDFGYMFVRRQEFVFDSRRIRLHGIIFRCSTSPYLDDTYATFDAWDDWYIDPNTFRRDISEQEIKILTKEEFLTAYKKAMEEFLPCFENFINSAEDDYKEWKNDSND